MRLIRNRPGQITPEMVVAGRSVATIGNYDGVHRGHRALLSRCRELAGPDAIAVVSFEPLPEAFFKPRQPPARLSTVHQKLSLLRAAGVDLTWLMRFDRTLAGLTPREFVEQVLVDVLRVKSVVVGEDFRFGRGRTGDVGSLRELASKMDFDVHSVAAVMNDGKRISSSGLRALLAAGNFDRAAQWLGRPFRMEGHVIRGARLGRKLGYPTANMHIRARPSPLQGVFAVFGRLPDGRWLPAVANLGCRPAVGGGEPLLEVHFFDFDEDLYGQRLEVQFVAKLRDELDFGRIDDLIARMKRDEAKARIFLAETEPPV